MTSFPRSFRKQPTWSVRRSRYRLTGNPRCLSELTGERVHMHSAPPWAEFPTIMTRMCPSPQVVFVHSQVFVFPSLHGLLSDSAQELLHSKSDEPGEVVMNWFSFAPLRPPGRRSPSRTQTSRSGPDRRSGPD